MTTDDDGPDKPTDDAPTTPLINVDVSRDTTRKAARLADDCGIAIEDALARLTVFDYPTDVLCEPAGSTQSSEGQ
jgi:hypothetical protein